MSDAFSKPDATPDALAQLQARLHHQDPREPLKLKLEVRQRIIETIEQRLAANPDDKHQRFILEEHLKAREAMVDELRDINMRLDARYQSLDNFVDDYVQQIETSAQRQGQGPDSGRLQTLEHEIQTWEELIGKVRARLVKRPGDPLLMRLLGEHQARLLSLQENRRLLLNQAASSASKSPSDLPTELPESVLESVYGQLQTQSAHPGTESESLPESVETKPISPQAQALQRELDVFSGMVEKTRERLAAKPELVHLKTLIIQHEARIQELKQQLRQFD